MYAAKILPGEYYVTMAGEIVTTVLGSCVSACVRDRMLGIGGMNHFMLPIKGVEGETAEEKSLLSAATRYGNHAMEHLINDILRFGGSRDRLEFKVFGGGKVLSAVTDIGKRNIDFVREYLQAEQFTITSEDLGGIYPRKVVYYPDSGG